MDKVFKNIPKKKFIDMLEITVKNVMCGAQTCSAELMNLNKIKIEKDKDLFELTKKLQDNKITPEKYQQEIKKINEKFIRSEEHFKFIECSLKNCVEFMKKQLLITIDIKKTVVKNDKELLNKLKIYKKLFSKKTINIEDIRKFYHEFM
uniref:Uncharacterized protein n=1 Tax=viral metagenome TaxID=1070528 RepID=A0A6C0LIM7_9ZZZZ